MAVLNRQAFAELKPEFPGEMTKLRLSVSLSREEKAEAKDEAPQHSHAETQRHCQANCSPGLAAAKPRLTKGPGEKLPCRHPAKAERRNAELLPAAISQSSRSNCCFYRLTWQGQKRGTGGGRTAGHGTDCPLLYQIRSQHTSCSPPLASSGPRCPGHMHRWRCHDLGRSWQHPWGKQRLGLPPPQGGFRQPSISSVFPLLLSPALQPRTPMHLPSKRCKAVIMGGSWAGGRGYRGCEEAVARQDARNLPPTSPRSAPACLEPHHAEGLPGYPHGTTTLLSPGKAPPSATAEPAARWGTQRQKGSSGLLCRELYPEKGKMMIWELI